MARVVLDDPESGFTSDKPVGTFAWLFNSHEQGQRYFLCRLPNSNAPLVCIPVHKAGEVPVGGKHAYWLWDGDEDSPTLTPSILHHSDPAWHGFVTAGRLVDA